MQSDGHSDSARRRHDSARSQAHHCCVCASAALSGTVADANDDYTAEDDAQRDDDQAPYGSVAQRVRDECGIVRQEIIVLQRRVLALLAQTHMRERAADAEHIRLLHAQCAADAEHIRLLHAECAALRAERDALRK